MVYANFFRKWFSARIDLHTSKVKNLGAHSLRVDTINKSQEIDCVQTVEGIKKWSE